MDGWLVNLTRAGVVGAGLMAGFFFAYSNGVMPALRKLPPEQGALAMQTINRDVQNPLFMVVFMGSTIVAAAIGISAAWTWDQPSAGLRLAGGGLFVAGNFLLTIAYNVPRNDRLDKSASYWSTFLDEWVPANHVRTATCGAACVVFVMALRS